MIEELLEITAQDEAGSFGHSESEFKDMVLTESVPLPKHYNITFIEVMIRDPLWAFVFWEIKASDREQFEKAADFEGYYLKVSPLNDSNGPSRQGNEALFTVQIKPEDTAWYLSLSPDSGENSSLMAQSQFKVEFCVKLGGTENVLAESNPVRLPLFPEFSPAAAGKQEMLGANGASGNKLVRLSGYGDFHVLRKKERQLRLKRGESECPNE